MARSNILNVVLLFGLLVLVACATVLPEPEPVEPAPEDPRLSVVQELQRQAVVRVQQGEYLPAISLLERAVQIKPDEIGNYILLARAHTLRGDPDQARAALQRGQLYAHPGSADAARIEHLLNRPE
ncbi:tetratricopeptide repeat protein [Salinispirillum sp. LH 10-3-1]|uniref:Tetratricopeptide repeat protein n=1 Tax=Salinispirillum sp. LH 10-3-1 TaxID=2952525 RepID=A0AB38YGD8_9GAMM